MHKTPCTNCPALLSVARMVLNKGFVLLSEAFRAAFPDVQYKCDQAKRRLLVIPLVSLRVGTPKSGLSCTYLCEYVPNVNCRHLLCLLNSYHSAQHANHLTINKSKLKEILSMAQNDRERESIRYTAFVASGLTETAARKHLGLERMSKRANRFEEAIEEIKAIRLAVDSISKVQEKVALAQFGIEVSSDSEDSSNSDSEDETSLSESDIEVDSTDTHEIVMPELFQIAKDASFNWFEITHQAELRGQTVADKFESLCEEFPPAERQLLLESRSAYLCVQENELPEQQHVEDALNGQIVSESEDDDPDTFRNTSTASLESEQVKQLILKKIAAIRRRNKREYTRLVSEKRFLRRKRSKKLKGIIHDYPNIGKDIETFVESQSIGADAWRRTGVLTFDGNKPVKQKVTFSRIKEHLEKIYGRKFAYGTVVELCVARNRRRKSSKRYKGVANVTCRRARKGFQLKYNPDNHWSSAFYQNLNYLQFTDGRNIVNINRDDAAGFRLDTLTTHRLHKSPVVRGKEILTTYTDYVNSYPSILQTTSYNLSGTKTTGEICAGVVKGSGVYPKNAAQHSCDLSMLQEKAEIQPAFVNPTTNKLKLIECVRVDGASDEGPSHLEVQYWWTLRHIQRPTFLTLITARNSGASHLNRVELQNGCLSLAHANLFIPSNLHGTCFDPDTGKVDPHRLKQNMDAATDVYLSRANNAPCGGNPIHLYKGADSKESQQLRTHLLTYLKGSKKEKQKLSCEKPEEWADFEKVWGVRKRHMKVGIPQQYAFYLKCCLRSDCCHPLCQERGDIPTTWFPGGPPLDKLVLPIPDPDQPWGSATCSKCKDSECHGHFLKPELSLETTQVPMSNPPSHTLKEAFTSLKGKEPSASFVEDLAKKTLLPTNEVLLWFDHLRTVNKNRQRGAEKAAETRRQRRQASGTKSRQASNTTSTEAGNTTSSHYFCSCGEEYLDITAEIEQWVGCDKCDMWYHCECVNTDPNALPESFICPNCS